MRQLSPDGRNVTRCDVSSLQVEEEFAIRPVIHKAVDMASPDRDDWFEAAANELARRVGDHYSISSWSTGVWERALAAGFSPTDAVEMLVRHLPADGRAERTGEVLTPTE
jgi:hypothetical protein